MNFIIYLPILISGVAGFGYIYNTLRGKTRPNRMTWLIWGIAPIISVIIQHKEGAGVNLIPVFMAGLIPALVFLASFLNKNAYWKLSTLDYVCGALSLLSLGLWIYFNTSTLSVGLLITSDLLAGIPTMIKIWKFPQTETVYPFLAGCINNIIGLLVIQEWRFVIYGFGLYLVVQNFVTIIFYYKKFIRRLFKPS